MGTDIDDISMMKIAYRDGGNIYSDLLRQDGLSISCTDGFCIYETCTYLTSESIDQSRAATYMIEMTVGKKDLVQNPIFSYNTAY
jgi:hypothetical protein